MVGCALLITGVLLFFSDRYNRGKKNAGSVPLRDVLVIGVAQAFATIPGLSRSGTTVSVGCFLGLDRRFALRYSFLMSIPAVLGANILNLKDIVDTGVDMTLALIHISNSLRSDQLENAVGRLKEELRRLGSLILACADETRVPAGGALAVDREGFSRAVTARIRNHPNITVVEREDDSIPDEGEVIVATGPLTSDAMANYLQAFFGCLLYTSRCV